MHMSMQICICCSEAMSIHIQVLWNVLPTHQVGARMTGPLKQFKEIVIMCACASHSGVYQRFIKLVIHAYPMHT